MGAKAAYHADPLAKMMDDLGHHRVDQLPLDNGGKLGGSRLTPVPAPSYRPPTTQNGTWAANWQNATTDGTFNDSDAAAVAGYNRIGDGRSYDRTIDPSANREEFAPRSSQARPGAKVTNGRVAPGQTRSTRPAYDPANPRARRYPAPAPKPGSQVTPLGGILPPGAITQIWDPSHPSSSTTSPQTLQENVRPVRGSAAQIAAKPSPLEQKSLVKQTADDQPQTDDAGSSPRTRKKPRRANPKLHEEVMRIRVSSKSIEASENDAARRRMRNILPSVGRQYHYNADVEVEKMIDGKRKFRPAYTALSSLVPSGIIVWELVMENGEVLREDVRDFMDRHFQDGSRVRVRRKEKKEDDVKIEHISFSDIDEANKFMAQSATQTAQAQGLQADKLPPVVDRSQVAATTGSEITHKTEAITTPKPTDPMPTASTLINLEDSEVEERQLQHRPSCPSWRKDLQGLEFSASSSPEGTPRQEVGGRKGHTPSELLALRPLAQAPAEKPMKKLERLIELSHREQAGFKIETNVGKISGGPRHERKTAAIKQPPAEEPVEQVQPPVEADLKHGKVGLETETDVDKTIAHESRADETGQPPAEKPVEQVQQSVEAGLKHGKVGFETETDVGNISGGHPCESKADEAEQSAMVHQLERGVAWMETKIDHIEGLLQELRRESSSWKSVLSSMQARTPQSRQHHTGERQNGREGSFPPPEQRRGHETAGLDDAGKKLDINGSSRPRKDGLHGHDRTDSRDSEMQRVITSLGSLDLDPDAVHRLRAT